MPAIGNVVIADAVPANHTLVPLAASMAMSNWAENSASIYDGNARLAITMSPPSAARKSTRNKVTLTVPILGTVDGLTTVARTMIFTLEGVIPSDCTAAEAANGYAMMKNLAAHATVQSYFADRVPVF